MLKKKICNLKEGDLFQYKGIIYEVWIKRQLETMCRYVNEHASTGYYGGYSEYLYCSFSNYTMVAI